MRWYLIHVKHFTQRLIENKYLNVIIFPVSTTAGSIEENILRCHRIPITTRSLISKPSSVVVFFPPGYVALWDSKTPHRPTGERVSRYLETSPPSRLPSWDGSPSLTLLPLFLSFIVVLPSFKENELPFWMLVSSTSVQKLFCGSFSAFRWSFDELTGEKVVSLSYSFIFHGHSFIISLVIYHPNWNRL